MDFVGNPPGFFELQAFLLLETEEQYTQCTHKEKQRNIHITVQYSTLHYTYVMTSTERTSVRSSSAVPWYLSGRLHGRSHQSMPLHQWRTSPRPGVGRSSSGVQRRTSDTCKQPKVLKEWIKKRHSSSLKARNTRIEVGSDCTKLKTTKTNGDYLQVTKSMSIGWMMAERTGKPVMMRVASSMKFLAWHVLLNEAYGEVRRCFLVASCS